jgi:hypothetical protein
MLLFKAHSSIGILPVWRHLTEVRHVPCQSYRRGRLCYHGVHSSIGILACTARRLTEASHVPAKSYRRGRLCYFLKRTVA